MKKIITAALVAISTVSAVSPAFASDHYKSDWSHDRCLHELQSSIFDPGFHHISYYTKKAADHCRSHLYGDQKISIGKHAHQTWKQAYGSRGWGGKNDFTIDTSSKTAILFGNETE